MTTWEDLAENKRHERDSLIQAYKKSRQRYTDLPPINISDTASLLKDLASGRYSCVRILLHFIDAAIASHELINCITEPVFEQAIIQAESLDSQYAATGKPVGPLHGLPFSVKDQFDVKGIDSTLGYSSRIGRPARRDCTLVKILKNAGAIVFVKTNLPQTIMIAETENPVFGITVHPLNTVYSPGGSSGGEAGLIAMSGSLLGWGTDLGGSIRMPAHLTGIFGLRPTHGRLPYQDVSVTQYGQETVPSVVGPMTRDLGTLALAMKTVIDGEPWKYDPKCVPISWQKLEQIQKMKFGVLYDDGFVAPVPPVSRALQETVDKIEGAGHEIIEWKADHTEIMKVMDELFAIDKGQDILGALSPDEPIVPAVQRILDNGAAPSIKGSVSSLWHLTQRRSQLQKQYLDKMQAAGIDFILAPTKAECATRHGKSSWYVGYTKFVNLLDLPALAFPVTTVQASDTYTQREYRTDKERIAWEEYKSHHETMIGMPIGLQLIGPRFSEERIVQAVSQILDY